MDKPELIYSWPKQSDKKQERGGEQRKPDGREKKKKKTNKRKRRQKREREDKKENVRLAHMLDLPERHLQNISSPVQYDGYVLINIVTFF